MKNEICDAAGTVLIIDLICSTGLVSSRSEARRLVIQKAVKLNDVVINDPLERVKVEEGQILKVGKRKFAKIKLG